MFTESKIHAGESSLSAVTPLIRTNQRYKWHGYDGVRFVHHYVIKEALVTSSSMIRGDGQTDMAFPGFLSVSGSLIPRKREARVLPVDNKQVCIWQQKLFPSYPCEWGFVILEGARQHFTWQEPSTVWGRQVGKCLEKRCTISQVISWGCKRRGCHFGNSSSTVPETHAS